MKATLTEYDGCFRIDLEAESITDAVKLTRLGVNHTKELRSVGAYATSKGEFLASVVIGRRREATSAIPRKP